MEQSVTVRGSIKETFRNFKYLFVFNKENRMNFLILFSFLYTVFYNIFVSFYPHVFLTLPSFLKWTMSFLLYFYPVFLLIQVLKIFDRNILKRTEEDRNLSQIAFVISGLILGNVIAMVYFVIITAALYYLNYVGLILFGNHYRDIWDFMQKHFELTAVYAIIALSVFQYVIGYYLGKAAVEAKNFKEGFLLTVSFVNIKKWGKVLYSFKYFKFNLGIFFLWFLIFLMFLPFGFLKMFVHTKWALAVYFTGNIFIQGYVFYHFLFFMYMFLYLYMKNEVETDKENIENREQ